MPSRRRVKLLLLGGAALAAVPALVLAQNPESILPPGFGDPQRLPPPEQPRATPTPRPGAPRTPAPTATPGTPPAQVDIPDDVTGAPEAGPSETTGDVEETTDSAAQDLAALPAVPQRGGLYDLPPGAVRSLDIVGVINVTQRGLPIDAFGNANGATLTVLMDRTDAPLPSRWASILLRRVLMSRITSPRGVRPADFVAARTSLLARMGEADAARMLAQSIDVDTYTPNMVRAAFDASLAAADPAGLCPLVGRARVFGADPRTGFADDSRWPLADAMCAAMEGEQARASTLIDQARRQGAEEFDRLLAEKLVGAGSETRRAVDIQWNQVSELTPWRFSIASATGAAIPDNLIGSAGWRIQAWLARAPMVPIGRRVAAAEIAAALGVFSATSMVDLQALALDGSDEANTAETTGGRLQTAYAGASTSERMTALRRLWESDDPVRRYGRHVMTALAAARIDPAGGASAADTDNLVASLLSAGLDGQAAAWGSAASDQGSGLAWGLLAVGAQQGAVPVDESRIDSFASADTSANKLRTRFLVAALAGLGRIDPSVAQAQGVEVGRDNVWVQAIDRAAALSQPGTAAVLAAVGMQANSWADIPPDHLFRIVRALRRAGLDFEARMIAAEALTRV